MRSREEIQTRIKTWEGVKAEEEAALFIAENDRSWDWEAQQRLENNVGWIERLIANLEWVLEEEVESNDINRAERGNREGAGESEG